MSRAVRVRQLKGAIRPWVCTVPLLLSKASAQGSTPKEQQSLATYEEKLDSVQQASTDGIAVLTTLAPVAKDDIASQLSLADDEHLQAGYLLKTTLPSLIRCSIAYSTSKCAS